jgi:hypothetical protein
MVLFCFCVQDVSLLWTLCRKQGDSIVNCLVIWHIEHSSLKTKFSLSVSENLELNSLENWTLVITLKTSSGNV